MKKDGLGMIASIRLFALCVCVILVLSGVRIGTSVKEYINNIHFNGIYHTRISHIYDNHCFNAGRRKGRDLADIDTQMKGEN